MLFKSQVFAQASGSVDGLTYSHNSAGMYTRARSIPVNPNTARQVAVRQALSQLAGNWLQVLNDTQRADWAVFAANTPLKNRLGDTIYAGGIAQYIRCNAPRILAGMAIVNTAPTVFDLPTFSAPSCTATAGAPGTVSIGYDNADAWANEDDAALLVFASRPVNQTRNFWAGPYQFLGKVLGDSGTPPTSPFAPTGLYTVVSGQRLHARVYVVRADGRVSASWYGSSVAT